jgi:hypothetical protein
VHNILQVIVVLTNRKIKQQPIRNSDWIAPQWNEELEFIFVIAIVLERNVAAYEHV